MNDDEALKALIAEIAEIKKRAAEDETQYQEALKLRSVAHALRMADWAPNVIAARNRVLGKARR